MSAQASTKCPAKGCAGVVRVETDGRGGVRNTKCTYCEKREAWAAKHCPPPPPSLCAICTAPIRPKRANGRQHHCEACAVVVRRAQRLKDYANRKNARAAAKPLPLRRPA